MRALVTGAAGFAGSHLCSALARNQHDVLATGLPDRRVHPPGTRWQDLDCIDVEACRALLAQEKPDWVFHLAGFSHVGRAEAAPADCLRVNFGGTWALLQACRDAAPRARVLLVSSAEIYGRSTGAEDARPLVEEDPPRPVTVYAVSKAAAEMAAHHAVARGLDVVVLRAFNHVGPGQSDDFVASAFARQVARVELGRQEPVIKVGNLAAVRDIADVRDVATAYVRAAQAARRGEVYNVTSGTPVSVQTLLDRLVAMARVPVRVEQDPARMRPVDVPVIHGSGEKLARDAGVRITLDLGRTLGDVLDYWRATESGEAERR